MRRGLPPGGSYKPRAPSLRRRLQSSADDGSPASEPHRDGQASGSNASNNEDEEIDESESLEVWSGFVEGQVVVDLDAMKSVMSRRSFYQRAFFNDDDDDMDDDPFDEYEMSTVFSSYLMETEVHMSTDQNDGSEIIAPSQSDKTFTCYMSARMDCRRHWLASLGHVSSDTEAGTELTFDCQTAAASASASSESEAAAAAAAATAAANNNCFTLWFNFEPNELPDREPSTFLVLKLIRLANNLRRIMYSKSSRNRFSTVSKSSENRSDDSR